MFKHSFLPHFLLVALIAFPLVPAAQAEVHSATVAVDGMSCPFCAFGVEKRLKKVDGVQSVAIHTKEGSATLEAKGGESIAVGQIPEAVERAGFTPGEITVDAEGRVTTDEQGRVVLQVSGTDQAFLLATFEAKMEERLHSLAARGASVNVQGPLHPHADDLSAISPETIEEVPK